MQEFLDKMAAAYYAGSPLISDDEFDALATRYNYNDVGFKPTSGRRHFVQMFSLQKCFEISKAPIDTYLAVETPKLDGAAVSLLYLNGSLELALTRGDGKVGQDITDKMALIVPNTIQNFGVIQITGEVVLPKTIPNARNLAAGALNLKNLEEFKSRDTTFIAYGISPSLLDTYIQDMASLYHYGDFKTITHNDVSMFPADGRVFRLNNNREYHSLGYTSKHPRGAFALKKQAKGVVTKLLDVVWQVGKSGVVSPVGILEPVMIGDATIQRATLHNIEYIDALGLEIGCNVEVIRSGEIIPRITGRVE